MQIVIFDLDHTLCRVNTSVHFGLYLYRKRILSLSSMLRLAVFYFFHTLGVVSIPSLHEKAFRLFFLGRNKDEMRSYAKDFASSILPKYHNRIVLDKMQQATSRGDQVILLSSSPDFLVEAIAENLGIKQFAATVYSLSVDNLIAKLGEIMEGEQKANYVSSLISQNSLSKDKVIGYSDSILDLPFLEAVGTPIAVNPDRRLLKECRSRGWGVMTATATDR